MMRDLYATDAEASEFEDTLEHNDDQLKEDLNQQE